MHCPSLLRTIFASLARANERARTQKVWDSPQTKLNSEIRARFLLNERGDPHFLFYKFNKNNVLKGGWFLKPGDFLAVIYNSVNTWQSSGRNWVLLKANERARVQNVRDFPQTKLDSKINASLLLNEHGDPHFLFYNFNENNIPNNWERNWQKSMATFLANEINATDRDVTGPTEQVQIMFPLKDKNIN